MENAEEARNAPLFEASVYTRGLLAAVQFNAFVPTQEEFNLMTERKKTTAHKQPPAGKSRCLLFVLSDCYFLLIPIKPVAILVTENATKTTALLF